MSLFSVFRLEPTALPREDNWTIPVFIYSELQMALLVCLSQYSLIFIEYGEAGHSPKE